MIYEWTLKTGKENLYNITAKVREAVKQSGRPKQQGVL